MDVGGLEMPVNPLAFRVRRSKSRSVVGAMDSMTYSRGIAVDAVPQVEGQDRHLRIREELRINVALLEIFGHRMVVGEVAVVDQRLVQPDERVRAAGVPHAALGGIALVGDPDVGLEIQQLVVVGHLLRVADDLQDHHIAALGEDKGPFLAQGGIISLVELVAVLGDELVFHLAPGDMIKLVLLLMKCWSTAGLTRTKYCQTSGV